jgi:hypothetical protein
MDAERFRNRSSVWRFEQNVAVARGTYGVRDVTKG